MCHHLRGSEGKTKVTPRMSVSRGSRDLVVALLNSAKSGPAPESYSPLGEARLQTEVSGRHKDKFSTCPLRFHLGQGAEFPLLTLSLPRVTKSSIPCPGALSAPPAPEKQCGYRGVGHQLWQWRATLSPGPLWLFHSERGGPPSPFSVHNYELASF